MNGEVKVFVKIQKKSGGGMVNVNREVKFLCVFSFFSFFSFFFFFFIIYFFFCGGGLVWGGGGGGVRMDVNEELMFL